MFFKKSSDEENSYQLNIELEYEPTTILTNILQKRKEINSEYAVSIPCEIFREGLSGLEAIIKYLKEEKKLTYTQISKILNRDHRTIWTTYNSIKEKKIIKRTKGKNTKSQNSINFNTQIIQNRQLSVLESISYYLKNAGLSIKEISEELGKNNKTIWTVLKRAEKKLKQNEVGK